MNTDTDQMNTDTDTDQYWWIEAAVSSKVNPDDAGLIRAVSDAMFGASFEFRLV